MIFIESELHDTEEMIRPHTHTHTHHLDRKQEIEGISKSTTG